MRFMAVVYLGIWAGEGVRNGEFNNLNMLYALGSYAFGYLLCLNGHILDKLEDAGY